MPTVMQVMASILAFSFGVLVDEFVESTVLTFIWGNLNLRQVFVLDRMSSRVDQDIIARLGRTA